jgi:hypothetical protein
VRGIRNGFRNGRCPIYSEDEDAVHILLKCLEMRMWGEQFLNRSWPFLNEWIVYRNNKLCKYYRIKKYRNLPI